MGDLVEVQRSGEWVPARVSRAPTDERPNDGSFRVKFDSDAYEMKCWYRDLRKPKDAEKIEMPAWVEDFTSLHASLMLSGLVARRACTRARLRWQ